MASSIFCSPIFLVLLSLISAVPIGLLVSLERSAHSAPTNVYEYHSKGWMRECSKWDDLGRRFLVTLFEGGVAEVAVTDDHTSSSETVLEERTVIKDADVAGNASLGLLIDRPRNRVLVVNGDPIGNSYGSLAAYDLNTWDRLFLTQLSGPGDEKSLADDVAIDPKGNAYITDAKSSKLWKVGVDGKFISIIRSPLFKYKEWYKNLVALNGIVYHPDGYLLVIHTFSGALYKIDTKTEEVKLVNIVQGSLALGDGIELVSPTKLAVAGNPSGRLVESLDKWETAKVVAKYSGPIHRLASSATVKDGKVYLNHMIGMGLPKRKHMILEAVFTPV